MGFGKRLKQARHQLGLSGPELAARLGIERSSIPHYEAGKTFPSVSVLMKMARILGVALDWLLFDECEASGSMRDKDLADYFVKADALTHRDRSLIKEFVDSLLARARLEEQERVSRNPRKAA